MEECALDMVHRLNDAALKDAQMKLGKEEYALGMGQARNTSDAAVKDVQTKQGEEECVEGTGLVAMHPMNLLLLDQNLNSLLQLKPHLTELPGLPSEGKKKVLFLGR